MLPAIWSRLPQSDSGSLQLETAIAPNVAQLQIAREPDCESEQIAQRIKPWGAPYLRISHHRPTHKPGFEQAICHGSRQQQGSDCDMTQQCGCNESEKAVGHGEDESAAKVPFGARITSSLRPAELILPHVTKGFLIDDVIDDVAGKHDAVARLRDQIPDGEVIGDVVFQRGIASDARQRILAHHSRRAKTE